MTFLSLVAPDAVPWCGNRWPTSGDFPIRAAISIPRQTRENVHTAEESTCASHLPDTPSSLLLEYDILPSVPHRELRTTMLGDHQGSVGYRDVTVGVRVHANRYRVSSA
jgi:hypothetical protein